MTKERTNARIVEKYKKQDPATLTRQEYDEICTSSTTRPHSITSKEETPNV